MIEIKNVYKRYQGNHGGKNPWILKDISLNIPIGVNVALIGENGAGKSTLLRLISGMDYPDRGQIIRNCRVSWPVGLSGGFQGSMTGRQNVKFVARTQGHNNEINKIINFVECFADIGDAFDRPIKTYSSGMKSRLSFGLSLAFDFDIYISDEATSVGDKSFKEKAKKLFKEKVKKASIIMVSHSEGTLKEFCDSAILLVDGNAKWYDEINEAIGEYHMQLEKRKLSNSQR
jgi:capsular polysaccharide transport system ATP-binding protein